MPNEVEKQWQSFAEAALHPEAGADQRREMKRAFMAGAWGMLMKCIGIGEEGRSDEEGIKLLADMEAELREFVDGVTAGRN